jgi:hypothetical protein
MKQRLACIHSRWRRFLIKTVLTILSWLNGFLRLRSRARVHWIGARRRPRLFERPLLYLLFPIAMLLLEPREYAVWAAIFGGFTAMVFPLLYFHYQLTTALRELHYEPWEEGR